MTEIRCPTCERLLYRDRPDGSFDLAGLAEVSAEFPEPIDGFDSEDAGTVVPLTTLPLSVRCLVCHPKPVPASPTPTFETGLPRLPEGAIGWDILSSHQVPVFTPLRGWRRLWARLRGRPLDSISGWRSESSLVGRYRVGEVEE